MSHYGTVPFLACLTIIESHNQMLLQFTVGRKMAMKKGGGRKATQLGIVLLFVAALAGCGDAPSDDYDFTGDVTKIVDGYTFYMTGPEVRVRIWGLAAPERGDPGGPAATRALAELISGQTLGCELHDTDRYGRPVAQCFLPDGRDIAAVMIEGGTAQEYCRYSGGHYGQCG